MVAHLVTSELHKKERKMVDVLYFTLFLIIL